MRVKRRATELDIQRFKKITAMDKALKREEKGSAFLAGNGQDSNDNILWTASYCHDIQEEDSHICIDDMINPICMDDMKVKL